MFLPVNLTPLKFVDTVDELNAMLEDLKAEHEIAVDLEHHSDRSFQGITCLIQLSTRKRDYILDALVLRSEISILNEVFTNPAIVKVFHGADSDIVWLQKDFSVYVVGLFDTYQAALLLGLDTLSLASLISTFCNEVVDKKYQRTDWRIRPLPQEMVNYARGDTHFLLYLYDVLKDLLQRGSQNNILLLSAFDFSRKISAKVYKKPMFSEKDCLRFYRKSKKEFNKEQLAAFSRLCKWRDNIARVEDESVHYVLPDKMLLQIAEILPANAQKLLACCNPIPPLVRQNFEALHGLVVRARNFASTEKPQLLFDEHIDNSTCPFKPFLKVKPNALKSLEESLQLPDNISLEEVQRTDFCYPHPYVAELQAFTPGAEVLLKVTPQKPHRNTDIQFVDTVEELHAVLEDLRTKKEIALDLKNHSYRSYQGLLCLIQISTRTTDYVLDGLVLRSEIPILNEIFTNPAIVKVFHGGQCDIGWLQRDFCLYLVNVFDLEQAGKLFGLTTCSLNYFFLNYLEMNRDMHRAADWRIRPLPDEMVNYATKDIHYILYFYDEIKNKLLAKGNQNNTFLLSAFDCSSKMAEKVYRKPMYSDSAYLNLYENSRKTFNHQQMTALRELFLWRDTVARAEDESVHYVLPGFMLISLAETLPQNDQEMLACCRIIPPLLYKNSDEVLKLMAHARKVAITETQKTAMLPSDVQNPENATKNLLNCPSNENKLGKRLASSDLNLPASKILKAETEAEGTSKQDQKQELAAESEDKKEEDVPTDNEDKKIPDLFSDSTNRQN